MSTGLFFVRAHDARAERQAEGAVEVIELGPLTVHTHRRLRVISEGPARELQDVAWSSAISVAARVRFVAVSVETVPRMFYVPDFSRTFACRLY